MRSVLLSVLLLCSTTTSLFALSAADLPNFFDTKDYKCLGGGCSDLIAQGLKIGALRRTPNTLGTFDFFDERNERQVILRNSKNSWGSLTFDAYDKNQVLIAKLIILYNIKSHQLIRFTILSADQKTTLATGVSNIFGTKHTIYVGDSWDIMAILTRPLFTWSRDSSVTITNRSQLLATLDPNVLAAVIALYSGNDMSCKPDPKNSIHPLKVDSDLQVKLKQVADARGSDEPALIVTEEQMKAAADLLNQKYRETYDDINLSEDEKVKQFVDFACDLIQSRTLQPVEEQAMLQFLNRRLAEHG
ncbi:MAG: hypothetical protein NXI01_07125 [Gammaproteobacteria bacterium]|nr:hypothetical protein [Gammaproteobacteria bacterium]